MRKPYTITKQREKWTEEEHRKFLEALKLHRRAWPRIQEHIGTKSAVQIRSHAQKFFAKMEKAHNEGIPLDQTLDIEIPPPRPKRKPCSPYPQKTCLGALSSYEQPGVTEMQQKKKQTSVDGSCLEVNHFQGATSASISFANKSSSNPCQDVAQLMQAAKNKTTLEEACGSSIFNGNTEVEKSSADFSARKGNFITPPTKRAQETIALEIRQSDRQVPSFAEHSSSSMSSYIHQLLPSVPPSTQFCSDQDAYKSFLNISSSVSGLILSTLLQNPTAHAAASIAASFWPSSPTASIPMELHSEIHKEISERVSTSYLSSSTAAIVAATVAAASAWWETHGILPMVPSTHPQSFSPAPPAPSPSVPAPTMGKDKILQNQVANTSELPLPQSSDLDASGKHERSHCHEPKSSTATTLRLVSVTGLPDSDEARDNKKPDASSSGSNTPSSNEAEKTTMLDKNEETNDEAKQVYYGNHFTSEADVHRHRSGGSIYELGQISKQGQLASGILFTGEVVHPADTDTEAITVQLDLNRNTTLVSGHNFAQEKICENNDNSKEGRNVKLKSEWRGFKPYKRCSMDGKEVKATQ